MANRRVLTADELRHIPDGSEFRVPYDTIVSPLAHDEAERRRITLRETKEDAVSPTVAAKPERTVALGADHGGFAMKQHLKGFVEGLGFAVSDLGVYDEAPADYPDIALAVARAVSHGEARFGIIVDGAGIGSCMVANKVAGVRAALCYDKASARNSREHNDANVLTLGGRMIPSDLAAEIVSVWLHTGFAGGRHARRVDKIRALDQGRL